MILSKRAKNFQSTGYYTARQLRRAGVAEPILWRLNELINYAGKQPRYSKYILDLVFGKEKMEKIEAQMLQNMKAKAAEKNND